MKIQYTISREDFSEQLSLASYGQLDKIGKFVLAFGLIQLSFQLFNLFVHPENFNSTGLILGIVCSSIGTSWLKNQQLKRYFWALVAVLFLTMLFKMSVFKIIEIDDLITYAVPFALFGGLWYFIFRKSMKSNPTIALMEKQAGKKLFPKTVDLEIDEKEVISMSDGMETKVRWEDFDFFQETEKWILLSKTGIFPIPIPKSELTAADLSQVSNWVYSKVKPKN